MRVTLKTLVASLIVGLFGAGLALLVVLALRSTYEREGAQIVSWIAAVFSFTVCFAGSLIYLGFRKRWLHNLVSAVRWGGTVGVVSGLVAGLPMWLLYQSDQDPSYTLVIVAGVGAVAGALIGGATGLALNLAFGWTLPWLTRHDISSAPSNAELVAADTLDTVVHGAAKWVEDTAESASEVSEGPRPVRLSEVCERAPEDEVIAETDLDFLSRVLKCPSCQFNSEAAHALGRPWCAAPGSPEIKSFKCRTFMKKAENPR